MKAVRLILSLYKSMKTSKPVKMPLKDFDIEEMVGFYDGI